MTRGVAYAFLPVCIVTETAQEVSDENWCGNTMPKRKVEVNYMRE